MIVRLFLLLMPGTLIAQLNPVSFSRVFINDSFWQPRQARISSATLPACIFQTEVATPRIRNFEKVAARTGEKHEGIYYDDSDVYKALEAIAYSLNNIPDPKLEQKADEWIDKIAAAQLKDGYLNTYFTLTDLSRRWTDMEKHEAYCAGHLIEAAVAYYNTTGKRKLLDVAVRFADHIDSTFRMRNRPWVTGHQEIELALVKLFRVTSELKYLKLAEWLLEQRGHGHGRGAIWENRHWGPKYCQDDVPVKQQSEITGHAVRAMYLYTGAADVAAAGGDTGYISAMKKVWEDVVFRNMYLTGGIGSSGSNEGFTVDYDLPNENAYCETCASVGMVFWNHRMNLLTGESRYIDILERSLYNGALDGLSLSGDRFFYGNPLASKGQHSRRPWFGTACCPSNIARLVASLGGYIYLTAPGVIYLNLFIGNKAELAVDGKPVSVICDTGYPWAGDVRLQINPPARQKFALRIRIPGFAKNIAVPGNLYTFKDNKIVRYDLLVNGKRYSAKEHNGYAIVDRTWNKGDVVELRLPIEPRQVISRPEVSGNRDRVAIQRGPIVYCVEGVDNGSAWNFIIPDSLEFEMKPFLVQSEDVVAIQMQAISLQVGNEGTSIVENRKPILAIPYYAWANRGASEMQVWLPTKIKKVMINSENP